MKKHLIYLGYTGVAHRIALFDENNIVTRTVPVKDIPVLSDDLEFLNCTVKNGVPYPNLMGAKVLCSCPKAQAKEAALNWETRKNLTKKELRAFPDKEPEYHYGWGGYGFSAGQLLRTFYNLNFWDGMCKENNFYIIGEVMYLKKGTDKYMPLNSLLCMTHTGSLFYMTNNTSTLLDKFGAVFVQVGTPKLDYPNSCHSEQSLGKCGYANVGIPKSEADKVIWVNRRGKEMEEVNKTAEYIWWGGGSRTTIFDMRKYPKARVVGVSGCAEDASVVILPDKLEEFWLGMFYECSSIKAVYVPATVAVVNELGLPPRRFKNVTIYSDSPLMIDFCKRSGVAHKSCASADDMLSDFYASADSEYISVTDAKGIAALGNSESDKIGENGTLWSAVLFSCLAKGMASEELQRRYPVVETCSEDLPKTNILQSVGGNAYGHGEYGKERCRTFAAALTQFYPLYTGGPDRTGFYIHKCRLGDYNLYVMKDVLNIDKLPASDEDYKKDCFVNHHIAMLEDVSKRRIIHRFVCNEMFYVTLCNLEGVCNLDQPPSGALRYADKLPAVYNLFDRGSAFHPRGADEERYQFIRELYNTFLPVMYGTAKAKRKIVGIDLHTGNLATMNIEPQYAKVSFGSVQRYGGGSLAYVRTAKNITVHPEETHVGALFAKDCVYNKK